MGIFDWFWTAVVVWLGWTLAPVIVILAILMLFGALYALAASMDWVSAQWRKVRGR